MYKLFLDDVRTPKNPSEWIVVRSYDEAVNIVTAIGFPKFVSFDHDLGVDKSGYDFAKYLVELDMDTKTMPKDFWYDVHSANPVGKKNIIAYLDQYLSLREEISE